MQKYKSNGPEFGDNITLVGYCEGKFGNVQIKRLHYRSVNVSVKALIQKSGKDTEGFQQL